MSQRADVAIVGAGIMGLAHAYAAASRGLQVVVFERSRQASGASVRNFGMIWPIGQPHGRMHQLALRSREHWVQVLEQAQLPYRPDGSLLVVYREDEAAVAREFVELSADLGYACEWLPRDQVLARSRAKAHGLIGGLWSPTELTVDPRVTLAALPRFLHDRFGVETRFGRAVSRIDLPTVQAGDESWLVDYVIVCSGDDFESLYPAIFATSGLTRVKLQMLRTAPQPKEWQLGPALAAGLTLRFYSAFDVCSTLPRLRDRIASETPEYDRWAIHGLVSETAGGELTLGDSHEYGESVDVFNRGDADELILALSLGTTILRETFGLWTPTYFTQATGMTAAEAASNSAWFPFFGGISVMLCGYLSDRLGGGGRAALMVGGLGLATVALLVLAFGWLPASRTWPAILVAAVAFLTIGPYSFLAGAMAVDFGGKQGSGTASGLIDGVGYLGGVVSGDSVARLSIRYGWSGAFLFLASMAFLSCVAAGVLLRHERRCR